MINFNNKKVLIIRFSSLGDVLLTTPILRALKKSYPTVTIHYLIKNEVKEAILFNPYIDKIIVFNKTDKLTDLRSSIRLEKYDYIIDLHDNLRSMYITKGLNVFRIKKPTLKKYLLVKFKINLLKQNKSVVEMYAAAIPEFKLDNLGLELFLNKGENVPCVENKTIGICPGAKHYTKRWEYNSYKELILLLTNSGYKVLLFGGTYDMEMCKHLADNNKNVENISTDNDLIAMGKNMLRCKLIVGNDSGLMHTASALKVPVIVIFTATVKEFGFAPYKAKSIIIENNKITCRPCSHIGKSVCPKRHFNCSKTITPLLVFNKLQKFYDGL
ncbi:MAG: glycosyltransferase family 9 protein [bacterium]